MKKNNYKKYKVAILGATGFVGQHLVRLLENHPWMEIAVLAASERSYGKVYRDVLASKSAIQANYLEEIYDTVLQSVNHIEEISKNCDIVFSATNLHKEETLLLENAYAKQGCWVTSCHSAQRNFPHIPMTVPYVNPQHLDIISTQRNMYGFTTGAITSKSNCSITSYVIALEPLREFGIKKITVFSEQAISGAGKNFDTWPEMQHNIIPYIAGEEEKSEKEPLKIWGHISELGIIPCNDIAITARCIRSSVANGHFAHVSVTFDQTPTIEEIITRWENFKDPLALPSSSKILPIRYFAEIDRPQPRLDISENRGMQVSVGQLQQDRFGNIRFSALAHNVILGAAGGAIWATEAAITKGLIFQRSVK